MKLKLALLCSLGLIGGNALACYTVYDRAGGVVYNEQTPPVDMSLPLHQTLPRAFPGGHMVFDTTGGICPIDQPLPRTVARSNSSASPLLTDRRTAQALHAPYTMLASGAALVPQRPDNMNPGVVIATSPVPVVTTLAGNAPDTRAMGAGPARQRSDTVITEMRDGMTLVQTGDTVMIDR
jgi:hypothetical protein